MGVELCLEDILLRSRNRFRGIVDAIPDALMVLDGEMRIVGANRAYAAWEGRAVGEVIGGMPFFAPCPERFRAEVRFLAEGVLASGVSDRRTCRFDGGQCREIHLELTATPLEADETSEALVVVVARDVSLQESLKEEVRGQADRLSAEVQAQTADLTETIRRLREAESARRDLFHMIVHDLKSPLAQITANLDLLDGGGLNGEQRMLLEAARIGGDDMALMIGNLLDVERMESGRARLAFEPVEVVELIGKVLERLRAHAAINRVRLELETSPEALPMILDRLFFERIVRNLLMNAVEFSPAESVIHVRLRFDEMQSRMVLDVEDEGPGIPASQREAIFQKYRQGSGRGRGSTGAGLGLAFCKLAAEAHHGSIEAAEAEAGRGACLRLAIPLLGLNGQVI